MPRVAGATFSGRSRKKVRASRGSIGPAALTSALALRTGPQFFRSAADSGRGTDQRQAVSTSAVLR